MLSDDNYATGQPFLAVFGIALAIGLMAVLGVAIGALVRNSDGCPPGLPTRVCLG